VRIGRVNPKNGSICSLRLNSPEQVLALYGKRWNIETDLRSLKRTVRLHHISARNESMMEKELLTAIGPTIWCALSWLWRTTP